MNYLVRNFQGFLSLLMLAEFYNQLGPFLLGFLSNVNYEMPFFFACVITADPTSILAVMTNQLFLICCHVLCHTVHFIYMRCVVL